MGEYIKCPNSNLLFYGTKLDINGNNCAIFEIPNYQKFLIRQTSLGYGSRDWYIGTRSAMDAETFLTKNPDITIEDLERGAVMFAKDANPSWAKRVHLYKVFDSKKNKDMKRVRDNKDYVEEPDTLVMYEGEEISYDMKCYDGYAIGKCNEDGADIPKTIKMTYPKISELSEDEIDEVLTYRGLEGSVKPEDITYGDVMMAMGELYAEYVGDVSDSRKIKDAEETPDVLDGILLIAFDDGEEENGYNEVKKHANEQGTIDGVQYETYDTDYQDGATLIDLCAATDDANGFVKALLTEWGIIDEVVDIDFEMSDLMKGEVSDSKRVSDMTKPVHLRGYAERYRQKRREKKENNKEETEDELKQDVADSYKVEDMVKPSYLRGYAERSRQKRREKKESYKEETEDENQKQDVADSRRPQRMRKRRCL